MAVNQPTPDVEFAQFLDLRYPGRPLFIAAYPAYAYSRICYFAGQASRRPRIVTDFHRNLLKTLRRGEKWVSVIILIEDFREAFQKADPSGRFFRSATGRSSPTETLLRWYPYQG